MSANNKKDFESIFTIMARPSQRSPLFIWMFDNHDRILNTFSKAKGGVRWSELTVEFEREGLTDRGGKSIRPGTARVTWGRVCKEKQRLAGPVKVDNYMPGTGHLPSGVNNLPARTGPYWKSPPPPISRPEDGTPVMPIDAKKWNDIYWLDEKDYIVQIDNLSQSLRLRQETYARTGRNILEALDDVPALGPRIYFP